MTSATPSEAERAYPRPSDLQLIPLRVELSPERTSFELTPDLARFDGALYGGTGVAAAVMAMEAATQRPAIWVVTQFVAQASVGERIEMAVETLAQGGRICQLRVNATIDGRLIYCALGATALPKPDGLTGQFEAMPDVTAPEDSPPLAHGPRAVEPPSVGMHRNLEYREAAHPSGDPSRIALWARLASGAGVTPAAVAYLADMVPVAVARGAGKLGAGFSLDNSLRFATVPATEWILLDLHGQVSSHGYGHGSFTAWSSDGALIATGSQTANMVRVFDPGDATAWQTMMVDAGRS